MNNPQYNLIMRTVLPASRPLIASSGKRVIRIANSSVDGQDLTDHFASYRRFVVAFRTELVS